MKGAGGTDGGIGSFLIGFAMLCGGGYLLLQNIQVSNSFGFGYGLYQFGNFSLTSGMILIPILFGIGMIFWNSKNIFGWLLAGGSVIALIFGVLSSLHFRIRPMSLFDLLVILTLTVGGLALFLKSLRPTKIKQERIEKK